MTKKVLKINLPLSENSLYVEITDENQPIKEILTQVAFELKEQGRFHESQQLIAYISDQNYQIHDVLKAKKKDTENEPEHKENFETKIEFRLE